MLIYILYIGFIGMIRYWIDRNSAYKIDQRIQKGLFLFACTNSCMNPIVYGAFNIRDRNKVNLFYLLFKKIKYQLIYMIISDICKTNNYRN